MNIINNQKSSFYVVIKANERIMMCKDKANMIKMLTKNLYQCR